MRTSEILEKLDSLIDELETIITEADDGETPQELVDGMSSALVELMFVSDQYSVTDNKGKAGIYDKVCSVEYIIEGLQGLSCSAKFLWDLEKDKKHFVGMVTAEIVYRFLSVFKQPLQLIVDLIVKIKR